MEVTAALVKELRDRTGIGMMDCKKALNETNGDIELAIEELRKKGLAKAAAKADREALEGAIKVVIEQNKAYVVSVSCETDFLANTPRYQDMLNDVISLLKDGKTKEDVKAMIDKDYSLEMGENLQVKDFISLEGVSVGAYVHSNNKLASVVLAKQEADSEKLKQVAMHITAANPEFLSVNDISTEVIEKEKSIQLEIMKNDPKMAGKPDEVLLKIIDGKMGKFASEVALLEQQFVINPDQKVKDFIGNETISSFYRFTI
ncbi:translation elongation factor Ts [Candidatus Gracilibacteria bacterium]|nr:translation elongation factor Ts [Candidatus Gracilibacteria bacterium]